MIFVPVALRDALNKIEQDMHSSPLEIIEQASSVECSRVESRSSSGELCQRSVVVKQDIRPSMGVSNTIVAGRASAASRRPKARCSVRRAA